jgi:TIR domain-containing protein
MEIKAFISYSSKDKKYGAAVRAALDKVNLESFLAHDDLRVSEEWKARILVELKQCKIFVPLLSKAFKSSAWCGQETGFVLERGKVLIIPLSIDGTVPYGFISHLQCHRIPSTGVDPQIFLDAVGRKWPTVVIEVLLKPVAKAGSFRHAEELIKPLVPYFERFSKDQATRFAHMAVDNGQIWDAYLCREKYLPQFLKLNKKKIPPSLSKALKYQIETQTWYKDKQP